MDTKQFVGFPLETVKKQLDDLKISYKIVENSDIQKKFDTILVVRATEKDGYVELVTDKFLLYI